MARRKGNNCGYERMFEALLRKREIPYVAVDEKKRPVTRYGPGIATSRSGLGGDS